MATMELRRVPYGTTFTVFGDEFVALDYINGGVLAIRRDIWKDAPFDREGVNDLRKATINGTLADYEDMICEAGAAGNLRTMDVDLRATDGTREYGCCAGICVSLLTLEQYGIARGGWTLPGGLRGRSVAARPTPGSCAPMAAPSTATAPTPMASAPLCSLTLPS